MLSSPLCALKASYETFLCKNKAPLKLDKGSQITEGQK